MEENPAAAPTTGTEENQTINQEAPAAPTANIPAEQIEAFNKFVAGQGGFDNAFTKWKELISKKAPETTPEAPKQPETPKTDQQPSQPQEPYKTPSGYVSAQEIVTQQYFSALAGQKEYEAIADSIRSGDILKEMADFNIDVTDKYGNINDDMVRKFLNLKVQTVPATAPDMASSSATPTVTYTEVGDTIDSRDAAMKVLSEPGHPKHDAALAFLRKDILK